MYAHAMMNDMSNNEDMEIGDVINPENKGAFESYMQALRRYVADADELENKGDKLVLWIRSNDDHEDCIRLFEDTLNICPCTGDVDYKPRFHAVEVICDNPDVLDLIFKKLME